MTGSSALFLATLFGHVFMRIREYFHESNDIKISLLFILRMDNNILSTDKTMQPLIVVFPLASIEDPFDFLQNYQYSPFEWNDLCSRSSVELTEMLSDQCKNNSALLREEIDKCEEEEKKPRDPAFLGLTPCYKFLENYVDGYHDVAQRDDSAFELVKKSSLAKLYAVVLIISGQYYGHIYSWFSPSDPEICFGFGIRNRVDSFFLRGTEYEVRDVAPLLQEGVRRFALMNKRSRVIIPQPLQVMMNLLASKLGFKYHAYPYRRKTILTEDILGPAILESADFYMENSDLSRRLDARKISFLSVD